MFGSQIPVGEGKTRIANFWALTRVKMDTQTDGFEAG